MKMKLFIAFTLPFMLCSTGWAQSGNHVFTGAEAGNFGIIDLATPGGQTWSTDRAATPGYFSAIGTATYTNPSDAANVNGYVKHYADAANQAFTYPVGTGADLRTLSISGTIPNGGTYATAWILGNPSNNLDPTAPNAGAHPITSVTAPLITVSTIGQWDWQDITNNAAGATITVSIPDMSTFAVASNLRLAGWNGTSWIDLSGSATANGNTENSTLSGTMQAGITALSIASIAFTLPVTLETFNSRAVACNQTLLSWRINNAIDFSHFELEKSAEGNSYQKLASTGYVTGTADYAYMDKDQAKGTYYYRLKMVDLNGGYKFSSTLTVRINCAGSVLLLYPNPVSDVVNISGLAGGETIRLYGVNGQLLIQRKAVTYQERIELTKYPAGTYVIDITDGTGNLLHEKLVKARQ